MCLYLISNSATAQQIFSIKGKKGIINRQGDTISQAILDEAWLDVNEPQRFGISMNGRFGVIDAEGAVIIEPKYQELNRESSFYYAKLQSKHGLLDFNGKVLIPFIYDHLRAPHYYSTEYWLVKKDEKFGIVNLKGELIAPIKYDGIYQAYAGLRFIAHTKDSTGFHFGVLDASGHEKIPLIYSYIDPFQNFAYGLLQVQIDYKPAYISYHNNQIKIPPVYKKLSKFDSDTLYNACIWVQDSVGKWGVIDSNNQVLINFEYNQAGADFYENLSLVEKDKRFGLIDLQGNSKLAFAYSYLEGRFSHGFMYFRKGKTTGYIQTDFTEIPWKQPFLQKYRALKIVKSAPSAIKNVSKIHSKSLLKKSLNAMLKKHTEIYNASSIEEHIIYYGLPDAFFGNFLGFDQIKQVKKEFIFPIIASESMRLLAWQWISPHFKRCFALIPKAHQFAYKRILKNLKLYMLRFNLAKVEQHLKNSEAEFGRYSWENDLKIEERIDRKVTSAVDRLIVYHKLISEQDAKFWVNKIADEVETW